MNLRWSVIGHRKREGHDKESGWERKERAKTKFQVN